MKTGDGVRKRGNKWRVRWLDANGRRREAVVEARSRQEAKEKRARLMAKAAEQRLGIWEGDPSVTIAETYKSYEKLAKRLADWRNIEIRFRLHILPALGKMRLAQITKNDIRRFLTLKEERGLSPRSIEHLRMRLVVLFNFAKDEGTFKGENPAAAVGSWEVPETPPVYLPIELVQPVVDAVSDRWRNLFAMAVYTGLRAGELRALTVKDVDLAARTVMVWKSGKRKTTKTKKLRLVPVPLACMPYLLDQVHLAKSQEWQWLFVDSRDRQLSRNMKPAQALREALGKLGYAESWTAHCHRGCKVRVRMLPNNAPWNCPKCGLRGTVQAEAPITFHDLRKTFANHVYELTDDPRAAQRLLGHANLKTTEGHYLGANARRLGQQVDALDFKKSAPSWPRSTVEMSANDRQTHGGEGA